MPNPARKTVQRHLAEVRRTPAAQEQAYGAQALANPEGRRPTMRGFKIAHGKLAAYRAEIGLVRLLGPHYARTEEEGRALLRELFTTPEYLPVAGAKRQTA